MIGIYKITNLINGKVYIGQSKNIEHRWIDHRSDMNNPKSSNYNSALYRAMRKYGEESFDFEIITECDECELDDMEIMYISHYNSYVNWENSSGYNLTTGGGGIRGYRHTEETKIRLSRSNGGENHPLYGVAPSQETRDKISKANSNPSEETRKKMSESKMGHKVSEETIRKIIATKIANGTIKKERSKEPHVNKKTRKVVCITTGKVFETIKEASVEYNASDITKCCRGKQKSSGKHPVTGNPLKWMYYDDYIKLNNESEAV